MHEGHRARMIQRLEQDEKSLQDHELLEILLYNAIPRKNTNELAHALLDRFGSLSALSRADFEAIKSVNGAGDGTAAYLKCVFMIMERMKFSPEKDFPSARNYAAFAELLATRLRGLNRECIELYATDKQGNILGVETYSSNEKDRVRLDPHELVKFFAKHTPKALVVAHNHLINSSAPSESDDKFTRQIQALCSFYGIPLYDHIIVSPIDIFSYHTFSRMEYVKTIPLEPLLQ